jgi:S-formylglutathione hydrolase FrmB
MGKSSGGYAAMVTPLLRPDVFGALASHSGDAVFENYIPGFRECARTLRDLYGGSYAAFWDSLRGRPAMTRPGDWRLVSRWAMAACYSADPDGSVRLPFDTDTGELVPEIWERWLAWDPVRMVPMHVDNARAVRAAYVDAGLRDEHYLDLGAEAFRRAMVRAGAIEPGFELFDDAHAGTEYRYPISIRYLLERLAA